jgi:hypothetical protein
MRNESRSDQGNVLAFLVGLAVCLVVLGVGGTARGDPILPSSTPYLGDPAGTSSYESFTNDAPGSFANGSTIFSGYASITADNGGSLNIFNVNVAGQSWAGGLNTSNSFNNGDGSPTFAPALDGNNQQGLGISGTGATINLAATGGVNSFSLWGGGFSSTTADSPITIDFFGQTGNLLGSVTDPYNHTATGDGYLDYLGGYTGSGLNTIFSVDVLGNNLAIDGLALNGGVPQANPALVNTPAPSSLVMLGSGALAGLGLVIVRRRRRLLPDRLTTADPGMDLRDWGGGFPR